MKLTSSFSGHGERGTGSSRTAWALVDALEALFTALGSDFLGLEAPKGLESIRGNKPKHSAQGNKIKQDEAVRYKTIRNYSVLLALNTYKDFFSKTS